MSMLVGHTTPLTEALRRRSEVLEHFVRLRITAARAGAEQPVVLEVPLLELAESARDTSLLRALILLCDVEELLCVTDGNGVCVVAALERLDLSLRVRVTKIGERILAARVDVYDQSGAARPSGGAP